MASPNNFAGLAFDELRDFLEEKVVQYNNPGFIAADPVSIPHNFSKKQDIEISGFLTAALAWGQRCTILRNTHQLMQWMEQSPHEFVISAGPEDLKPFKKFIHRTFNGEDCIYFLKALRNIYMKHGGLENLMAESLLENNNIMDALSLFHDVFFELPHPARTRKHIAKPSIGASAKRLNMFLRWMVRADKAGVDFGIWKQISPSFLMCPLDVHTGNVARKLGILSRKQNDRKAVEELTDHLKRFDPEDPAKYDFALFGLGIYEGFAH